jgi:hypothetical protein
MVSLRREADAALDESEDLRRGRAAAIATQGRFLITHLVFHTLDHERIDDPVNAWEQITLPKVRARVQQVVEWLVHHVDATYGVGSYPVSIFKNPERCRVLAERVRESLRSGREVPAVPAAYVGSPAGKVRRNSPAISILVEAAVINEGAALEFQPQTREERDKLAAWVNDDPRRGRATWINSKSKPLLWEADGQEYAPSTLVAYMRSEALGKFGAIQGTKYWFLRGGGSLVELAEKVRDLEDD